MNRYSRRMNKNIFRKAFLILTGMLLFGGSLFACQEPDFYGTVSGQLVDARDYGDAEANLSEQDQVILHRAAMFGPHLVLIEDGTSRVRPFYYGDSDGTVEEGDEAAAPFVGRHVSVNGCIGGDAWPSVQVEGEIQ